MKKLFGIAMLLVFLGAMVASCTPHKQSCAAYQSVELEEAPTK
ncbi:MAG: hypothetical protein P8H59_11115 [Flavobacteriales bacterium]|nr:hypothetical protein [Flavobacteriales bacterium]MDG1781493.1 hypothetical protein [Flavobacteriales bacterium]MDG2245408.1 hypothetical protein [Flavobacteriales bacterium]